MKFFFLLLLTACASVHPSLDVGYVAAPATPRWVSPLAEGDVLIGRLNVYGGYEATLQSHTKPGFGPVMGMSFQVWP